MVLNFTKRRMVGHKILTQDNKVSGMRKKNSALRCIKMHSVYLSIKYHWVSSSSNIFEHCHSMSLGLAASWLSIESQRAISRDPSPTVVSKVKQHDNMTQREFAHRIVEFGLSPSPWCSRLCLRRKVRKSYWRCCSREGLQNLKPQHQAIFRVPETWHSPQARDIESTQACHVCPTWLQMYPLVSVLHFWSHLWFIVEAKWHSPLLVLLPVCCERMAEQWQHSVVVYRTVKQMKIIP